MANKTLTFNGVQVTPSQKKVLEQLQEMMLKHHGEGYEFKRFEVYPFSSNRTIEVLTEVGKSDETPLESITNRTVRQIFIGERGGCELSNPADSQKRGKIKDLQECVKTEVL